MKLGKVERTGNIIAGFLLIFGFTITRIQGSEMLYSIGISIMGASVGCRLILLLLVLYD